MATLATDAFLCDNVFLKNVSVLGNYVAFLKGLIEMESGYQAAYKTMGFFPLMLTGN